MDFIVKSPNPEIEHKLNFLFSEQIEDDLVWAFEKDKGEYVIEYDPEGGVLGLVLKITPDPIPAWQTIDTIKMKKYWCLNRIAMIHLMCFFEEPADMANFEIILKDEKKCVCGAEKVKTTHSTWCDKFEQ